MRHVRSLADGCAPLPKFLPDLKQSDLTERFVPNDGLDQIKFLDSLDLNPCALCYRDVHILPDRADPALDRTC